jgi:hypothetical protein
VRRSRAASELQFVGLVEAVELALLLADRRPDKCERAAGRVRASMMGDFVCWKPKPRSVVARLLGRKSKMRREPG